MAYAECSSDPCSGESEVICKLNKLSELSSERLVARMQVAKPTTLPSLRPQDPTPDTEWKVRTEVHCPVQKRQRHAVGSVRIRRSLHSSLHIQSSCPELPDGRL
ncbi:Hypothetical predicted protein [Pelobates cultripes]|uniref:Uncharacterized protein n=1 Tax=Pelobates cultripes TaxID=61616 RepID=A0AAD1RLP9_PELCU|nr:Hypothetical predicted protein [Pelobates cultripes]